MGWLWQDYNPKAKYCIAAIPQCPGLEKGWAYPAQINILPRLQDAFIYLLADDLYLDPAMAADLFNCLLHFLARLDFQSGWDLPGLIMEKLESEIKSGLWGETGRANYEALSKDTRLKFLRCLYAQERRQRLLPELAMREIFPASNIYIGQDELIICINAPKTTENRVAWELIGEFCLPMATKARVFWQQLPMLLGAPEGRLNFAFIG